ncbi:acyl-CoA thioesterase [Microbacterium sp. 5K110]|uniref:acyl-CoA thioesterase n=1 Tax=unclassified Microbacterium TaxID=2609290 RepID=UPI0010FEFAA0|nr:acyl-CoA thioesterase [Microbacterium sp. 5K110]TLF33084.1 acyl-CoA thioesterase [Microbacterium sp. 5K110]
MIPSTMLQVRWADTDQYGHVNNVAVARLVEEARIRLFGLPDKPAQAPPGRAPALAVLGRGTFTVTAAQRVEYTSEMPYTGGGVRAEAWLSRIGTRSLTIDCRLLSDDTALEYARARTTLVIMDIGGHRPRDLTRTEREDLAPYRAEPLAFRD